MIPVGSSDSSQTVDFTKSRSDKQFDLFDKNSCQSLRYRKIIKEVEVKRSSFNNLSFLLKASSLFLNELVHSHVKVMWAYTSKPFDKWKNSLTGSGVEPSFFQGFFYQAVLQVFSADPNTRNMRVLPCSFFRSTFLAASTQKKGKERGGIQQFLNISRVYTFSK